MSEEPSLSRLSRQGMLIVNNIRMGMVFFLALTLALGASQNHAVTNLFYGAGIGIYAVVALVNFIFVRRNRDSEVLRYLTVIVEVSLPSVLKLNFGFIGMPHLIAGESVLYGIYYFVIALTLLQNRRAITVAAGAVTAVEYITLLFVSVFVWDAPVMFGAETPGFIIMDNEIGKLLIIAAFTGVCYAMLRNVQNFLSSALERDRAEIKAHELEEIISRVHGIADGLLEISREQDSIGNRFAELSQEQAALSEEISANFEELTASIEQINRSMESQADEGKKTRETVKVLVSAVEEVHSTVNTVTAKIGDIMKTTDRSTEDLSRMLETMGIINQGGSDINNFVSVINDITDKINLLSLNASIEAARAGEHGRGFAVVADEIGKLATATSDNSKEIAGKIGRIIEDILAGMKLAETTKKSTDQIFNAVKEVSSGVREIVTVMDNQRGAVDMVDRQAEVVDRTAKMIAASTNEQRMSMEASNQTIQKLSEIAQSVADSNERIRHFTGMIYEKASDLESVIAGIR